MNYRMKFKGVKDRFRSSYGITALVIGSFAAVILFPHGAFGQSTPPLPKRGDVVKVHYVVSLIGEFAKVPEPGKDLPTTFFHLKRIFTGDAKLSFAGNSKDPKFDAPLFDAPRAVVDVDIDDFAETVFSPICGEYETVEAKCKGNASNNSYSIFTSPAFVLFDNFHGTFSTSFPLVYSQAAPNQGIPCTTQAYDNPGHEPNGKAEIKNQPVSFFEPPNVAGFIADGKIQHKLGWSKVKQDGNSMSWISDILNPDKPLVEGVPDSKDNVHIIISYELTRTGN